MKISRRDKIARALVQYFSPDIAAIVDPKTEVIATDAKKVLDLWTKQRRTRALVSSWIDIFDGGGLIAEAIDLYPLFMFSKGYTFTGNSTSAIAKCADFISGFDFESICYLSTAGSLVAGDYFSEIAVGRGARAREPVALLRGDPSQFEAVWDKRGIVTGYKQYVGNNRIIDLDAPDMLHVQLLPSIREGYGTSLIKRSFDDMMRDVSTVEAIAAGIKAHGTPKWGASVGEEGETIPETVLKAIVQKLGDLNAKSVISHPRDVAITQYDTAGVNNVGQYSELTLTRLTASLGVPIELLGLRQGTTDNTAVSRVRAFLQKCENYQYRLERQMNLQVFDRVTGIPGSAKISFNGLLPDEIAEKAAWIAQIISANPMDPYEITPREWIQEQLGITPMGET